MINLTDEQRLNIEQIGNKLESGYQDFYKATGERAIIEDLHHEIYRQNAPNEKYKPIDWTCSGCINRALKLVRNLWNAVKENENPSIEVEIDETKRADETTKEVITNTGSVADNHDLERKGNFTREQLEAMDEDEIKLIAKDLEIKIGRSGKEVLIDKILDHGNESN